jgi:hypothetical protein
MDDRRVAASAIRSCVLPVGASFLHHQDRPGDVDTGVSVLEPTHD